MTESSAPLRAHLVRLLDWEEAHVGFDKAVDGIPAEQRGARPPGFDHSAWQLVEHMRIAQKDLLDFCRNKRYSHALEWPRDYWPATAAPPDAKAWSASLAEFKSDQKALKRLIRDSRVDLFALVPTGKGRQTYLRAILLVAVRRALGVWPS